MKTIVIRPEIIGFDNTGVREPKKRLSKVAAICLVFVPVVAVGGWLLGRTSTAAPQTAIQSADRLPVKSRAAAPVISQPAVAVVTEGAIDLQSALDQNLVVAELVGNGREKLEATISNRQAKPLAVKVSFGQVFEGGRNVVVATHNAEVELPAGQCGTLVIPIAATRSTNKVAPGSYRLSSKTCPKIDLLLAYAQDHPELTPAALQTAVLTLTDNLPMSSLCKFTPATGDLPSRFDTNAFRVETTDLVNALATLREIGVPDRDVALTVDPQLKLEAMIEPLVRASAMRYYGIAPENEWAFWKAELLAGESGTRHYALFGIARFYPEVALDMLPKWAREKRTNASFRMAAVQALADTRKAEALPLLNQLAQDLGRNTELGRAALEVAKYLNTELNKMAAATEPVAFRGKVAAVDL